MLRHRNAGDRTDLVVLGVVNFHNLAADGRFKLSVVVSQVRQDRGRAPRRGRRGEHSPRGRGATRSVECKSARHDVQFTANTRLHID